MKTSSTKELQIRLRRLLSVARIPLVFGLDKRWMTAKPSFLKSVLAYNDGRHVRVREAEQDWWMRRFLKKPRKFLTKPYFITILGDHFPESALRVGMGLASYALQRGYKVRAFHTAELRWEENSSTLARPTDPVSGETRKYDLVLLHGAHTDDMQIRRQLTRDFFLSYKSSFRILVLYGEDPLTFLHTKLGLNPNVIFSFPGDIKVWKDVTSV